MTFAEFCKRLAKTRGWTLDGARIRRKSRNRGGEECPITAVCYCVTRRRHGIGKFNEAAREIGLADSVEISRAADYTELAIPHPSAKDIRRQLLAACKLTEAAP